MMEGLHQVQDVVEGVLRVFDFKRVSPIRQMLECRCFLLDFLLIIFECSFPVIIFGYTPELVDQLVRRHDDSFEC